MELDEQSIFVSIIIINSIHDEKNQKMILSWVAILLKNK